jgi:hypothetical protein
MDKNPILAVFMLFFAVLALFSACAKYNDMEFSHSTLKGYLFINEVMAQSLNTDDWIELYNPTSRAIDLSGFYLSDSRFFPLAWAFPDGTVIAEKGFLVVKANNQNKGLQTNFRLGASESVVLTTPGGTTEIDSIDFTDTNVPYEQSYGRSPDGSFIWITFTNPSKGSANLP